MRDIFLSYSSKDRERAVALERALVASGLTVWWDRQVDVGEEYDAKIERELADSLSVVVLWSNESVRSKWVKAEAQEAAERGVLLPALLDSGLKPPLEFRFQNAVDLSGWAGEVDHPELERLIKAVRSRGEREAAPVEAAAKAEPEPEPEAAETHGLKSTTEWKADVTRLGASLEEGLQEEGPKTPSWVSRISGLGESLQQTIDERPDKLSDTAVRKLGQRLSGLLGRLGIDGAEPQTQAVPVAPSPRSGLMAVVRYFAWSFSIPFVLLVLFHVLARTAL